MDKTNSDRARQAITGGVERREILTGLLVAGAFATGTEASATTLTAPLPNPTGPAAASPAVPAPWLVLNDAAAQFLTLAVDILIPADALSPSASQLGVVTFIDRQLGSAWGAGVGTYRMGPFRPGTPEQGDQHPLPPRDFILAGIAALLVWLKAETGRAFAELAPAEQVDALKRVEAGQATLEGVEGRTFFDALLQITMEGFFADPVYGGNRDMAGWRMLGFPGLPAFYAAEIAPNRGRRYTAAPQSIVDFQ